MPSFADEPLFLADRRPLTQPGDRIPPANALTPTPTNPHTIPMPDRIGTVPYLPHEIFGSEQGQLLWDE
jgi:hypothetical protein